MLAIKLVRYGKKNLPAFRVAVADGNRVVEFIGSYYPHPKNPKFEVAKDSLSKWLKAGAKPSAAVAQLVKGKYEFKRYVPQKAELREAAPIAAAPVAAPVESAEASAPEVSAQEEAVAAPTAPAEPTEKPVAEPPASEEVKEENA